MKTVPQKESLSIYVFAIMCYWTREHESAPDSNLRPHKLHQPSFHQLMHSSLVYTDYILASSIHQVWVLVSGK